MNTTQLAQDHARQVLGRGLWPDYYSPGQHDDYLWKEGCWGELRQRCTLHGRVQGGPGEYNVEAHRVQASDKWAAAVVLASLCSTRPSPELLACATVLISSGDVQVLSEGP